MAENPVDIEAEMAICGAASAAPAGPAALAELRAARDENARLRRALEDVVRDGQGRSGGSVYMVHKDKFLAARAALKGTP